MATEEDLSSVNDMGAEMSSMPDMQDVTNPDMPSPQDAGRDAGGEDLSDMVEDMPPVPMDDAVALVEQGTLRGVEDEGVFSFRSVPYAAAPVGALRWKPPAPAPSWDGERLADAWPEPCPQVEREDTSAAFGSEDCLYVNVWKPEGAESAPVLVFIHGGGNMFGSTSEINSGVRIYSGAKLARKYGAVVVTLQYRLNTFGYLSLPALDDEVTGGASGNWGLRDQIAALGWIERNIEAFGGSPDRTLLFGESGGAASVCAIVAAPSAAGLFDAAIIQSGGCGGMTLEQARANGQEVAAAVGCDQEQDVMACMRSKSMEELVVAANIDAGPSSGIARTKGGPQIDGVILDSSPLASISRGEHNKVPLVFGANADETAWPFFGIIGQTWSETKYKQYVRSLFGVAAANQLFTYYDSGINGFANHTAALIGLTTDIQFVCPARSYTRAAAASQQEPVYRYIYDHAIAGQGALLGAFHGLELLFQFQHMQDLENYTARASDLAVQDHLGELWVGFADGAPPEIDGVVWPTYDSATDPYLLIQESLAAGQGYRAERCDLIDGLFSP